MKVNNTKNMQEKRRVTAIVGAGATLGICPIDDNYPSTTNITKKVLEPYKNIIIGNSLDSANTIDSTLVFEIYKHLCNNHLPKPISYDSSESYSKINFELIFHIMELLYTHDKVWNFDDSEYIHPSKYEHFREDLFSPFASFVQSSFEHREEELNLCMPIFIQRIMDIVNIYDTNFKREIRTKKCQWYKNFWAKSGFCWDVFNFNYDTTIEYSLKRYNDGYIKVAKDVEFKRFDIRHLLENKKRLSTINHMHGCIMYGSENLHNGQYTKYLRGLYDFGDWFKYATYEETPKSYKSDNVGQNRQSYLPTPIITGLDKIEKLSNIPFSAYKLNLEKQILNNNALLITGYSFGDLYVNSILERMRMLHGDNMRIVIIDYWKEVIDQYNSNIDAQIKHVMLEHNKSPKSKREYIIEKERVGFMQSMIKNNIGFGRKINIHEEAFLGKVFNLNTEDITSQCELKAINGPLIAKNKQLMIFFHGFRDAVDNYQNEIYNFLQS